MRIENVDLFYLSMPEIRDIGDGSQDALLFRVQSHDGLVGWGESEAAPLVSIANWVCPMSHSACKNVRDSVLGRKIERAEDIVELGHEVRARGLDVAQTDHTWSGVEIALWDMLGKRLELPAYQLLGYHKAYPKIPYASQLFGDTPEETSAKAKQSLAAGFRAVKFGWGPYGKSTAEADADQVEAARAGLGEGSILLVDAGTVWGEDVEAAKLRLPALEANNVLWLEEPFVGEALNAYSELSKSCQQVRLAGGEGANNFHQARNLLDHGQLGFVQIDAGRIGGIAPAKRVVDYAASKRAIYVNHTFTTQLALAASLTPYAGLAAMEICEYPVEPSALAQELTKNRLPHRDGKVSLIEAPGLGIEISEEAVHKYNVSVEITVQGTRIYGSELPSA